MCLLPLALDFKSPDSATIHSAQSLIVFPSVCAAIALIMIGPNYTTRTPLRGLVTAAFLLSVGGSVVGQVINGNDVGNYLRVLLPFVLFALGFWVACRPWHPRRLAEFEKVMWYSNVICLVYTFIYGLLVGWPVHDVRYRIISPTLLALQGMLLFQFIVMRRFTVTTVLTFVISLVVAIVSVTRSLFVGTALLSMLAIWLGSVTLGQLLRSGVRALGALLCIGVVVGATVMVAPEITSHWTQRLFAAESTIADRDPTTLTRLAEMRYQFDDVTSDASKLLLGEGYGHEYGYSLAYLPYLQDMISEKEYYGIAEWTAGHNFWVYQLYAGGLLFGMLLPIAIVGVLLKTAFAYRRWRRIAPREPLLSPFGRAVMMLAALPATSVGGNPLGARFSGLMYGLALGFSVALYMRLRYRFEVEAKGTRGTRGRPGRRVEAPFEPPVPQPVSLNPLVTPEPR
jgi:hypothetical protein